MPIPTFAPDDNPEERLLELAELSEEFEAAMFVI
jgi:hypothetical protein